MKLMKRFFNVTKQSTRFYKFLFSYIILVISLMLFMGGAIYGTFVKTLQKEVEESNQAAMIQIRNSMDMKFREMEQVALEVGNNLRLAPFAVAQNGYDSLQAVNELKKYKSSNALIEDIVVYYRNVSGDKMYAASGVYDGDVFFNHVYRYEDWNPNGFTETVKGMRLPAIRGVETVWLNGLNKSEMATYMYPLPAGAPQPAELVMFLIRGSEVKKLTENFLKDYFGYVFILDGSKKLFMSIAPGENTEEGGGAFNKLGAGSLKDGISSVVLEQVRYSVVKQSSDYNGWSYIIAMPSYQFMQKVEASLRVFIIIFLAVLMIGIFLSVILAAGNYKPLKKLAESITNKHKSEEKYENKDEIVVISRVMDEVTVENRGLLYQLHTQSGVMKEQFLMRLLKGRVSDIKEVRRMMDISSIQFSGGQYVVIVFLIDHYTEFEQRNTRKMQDVLKFNIVNISEELSTEIGCGYGIEFAEDKGVVLLLEITSDRDVERHVAELAYRTKDVVKKYFEFTLTAGVSRMYGDILETGRSFLEARTAACYRMVKGTDRIIFYNREMEKLEASGSWYPSEQENRLIAAMKLGNYGTIMEIVETMMDRIRREEMSFDNAQRACTWIVSNLQKTLEELQINFEAYPDIRLEDMIRWKYDTAEEFMEYVKTIAEKLCKLIEGQKESKNCVLRDHILQYVKEHYNDNTLCLEKIASCYKLSSSYITRYFKDHTGYSLKQYIDMFRNNKAKELLKDTSLTLKDIISEVGYVDETNFIRQFRKKEGITPTQYRNIHKAGNKSCESV